VPEQNKAHLAPGGPRLAEFALAARCHGRLFAEVRVVSQRYLFSWIAAVQPQEWALAEMTRASEKAQSGSRILAVPGLIPDPPALAPRLIDHLGRHVCRMLPPGHETPLWLPRRSPGVGSDHGPGRTWELLLDGNKDRVAPAWALDRLGTMALPRCLRPGSLRRPGPR